MTDPHQTEGPAVGRASVLIGLLLGVGSFAVLVGLTVAGRAQTFLVPSAVRGPLATLPVSTQTGYLFPNTPPPAADQAGLWLGVGVVALGVVLASAGVVLAVARRRTGARASAGARLSNLLVAAGVALALTGVVGGLVAKWVADRAALAASSATRMTIDSSVALRFDPSSAHHVAPDETLFWLGVIVTAVGVLVATAGNMVATSKGSATV
jgi:hypothetical protein